MASIDDPFSPNRKKRQDKSHIRIADPDGRKDVILSADTHKVTDQMVTALKDDQEVYQRGGELVHVIRHESEKDKRFPPGTPVVRPCPLSWLTDHVSSNSRCLAESKKGPYKHVAPPAPRVRAVMELGAWPGIRCLDTVIEAPSMRPDGTIIQVPGYDAATRSLYVPNCEFLPVPESPTQSDAVLAYSHLAGLFSEFPYVSLEHQSATVSCILTLLVRPAILGSVPCWVFDAASKRSGKSLQMDAVCIIATGRCASRMTYPSDDDKELESVLSSYALAGARIVPFDNVNRPFGGAALDKCVTAIDSVDLRVLGRSELRTIPWRAAILASGNNVSFRDDMLPRILCPRIESPLERPEERTGLPNLRAQALSLRPSLVCDALTILRAYVVAGRPAVDLPRWGGFDAWVDLVPSALVWAGAPNPMGARRGLEGDEDPVMAAESALLHGWASLCRQLDPTGITVSTAVTALYPGPRSDEPPDGNDNIREAIANLVVVRPGSAPATRALGDALRRLKGRPICGKKLISVPVKGGIAKWRVIPS